MARVHLQNCLDTSTSQTISTLSKPMWLYTTDNAICYTQEKKSVCTARYRELKRKTADLTPDHNELSYICTSLGRWCSAPSCGFPENCHFQPFQFPNTVSTEHSTERCLYSFLCFSC